MRPPQVKRPGTTTETQWIIIGSYVLDILFDVNLARDIDVVYLKNSRRPTQDEIYAWVDNHHYHRTTNNPDPHPVGTFSAHQTGGMPCFNIHYWQLHRDGVIYEVNPHSGCHQRLCLSTIPHLQIIDNDLVSREQAENGLIKMRNYPALHSQATEKNLRDIVETKNR